MTRTKTSKKNSYAFKHDSEVVAQRDAFARSGAAGVHADQKARKSGTFRTNRVATRRARIAVAANDGW
ncbi:hypothetical protein LG293_17145 (plasmid) [Citricoccus nitrophenolicus]